MAYQFEVGAYKLLFAVMEVLNGEIRRLSLELKRLAGLDEDVRLLMTIPGVGYYTALLIKAEVGNVNRFKSDEHLCSYAGIVPSTYSSGSVTRHGGMTREGSKWLRWAMVEAATTHIKYDTTITRAYHRIAERRGRKVALIATARRLLLCCYRRWMSPRDFAVRLSVDVRANGGCLAAEPYCPFGWAYRRMPPFFGRGLRLGGDVVRLVMLVMGKGFPPWPLLK